MNPVSHEQLSAYLDGALSASEKDQVDRALAESPDLRTELARLRALGQLIKSVPAQEPPADFYSRVLNKTCPQPRRWIAWSVPLATALAASLVMVYVFQDSKLMKYSALRGNVPRMIAWDPSAKSADDSINRDSSVETGPPSIGGSTEFSSPPGGERSVKQNFQVKIDSLKDRSQTIREKGDVLELATRRAISLAKGREQSESKISRTESAAGLAPSAAMDVSQRPVPSVTTKQVRSIDSASVADQKPSLDREGETQNAVTSPKSPKAQKTVSPDFPEWRGTSSGITDARQIVIRSKKEWEILWAQHQSIQYPPQPVPIVDFEKQMVVGVFSGDKGSSGYKTTILDVVFDAAEVRVFYHLSTPERQSDMGFLAVMTQPHHLKSVPRSDLPVRFVEK